MDRVRTLGWIWPVVCLLDLAAPTPFSPRPLAAQSQGGAGEGTEALALHCAERGESGQQVGGTILDLLTTEPLTRVAVRAYPGSAKVARWTTTTDADGRYFFCSVTEDQDLRVTALLPDGGDRTLGLEPGPRTWAPVLYAESVKPARVDGTVRMKAGGAPVSGASVTVDVLGLSTRTDAAGAFTLRGVAGRIPLRIHHPSRGSIDLEAWLDGGFEYRLEAILGVEAQDDAVHLFRGTERVELLEEGRRERAAAGVHPSAAGLMAPSYGPADWQQRSVQVGSTVRVAARGRLIPEGTLTDLSAEAMTIQDGVQQWTVPLADLDGLDVKTRSSKRLAFGLGLMLAGVGAVFGSKFIETQRECWETRDLVPQGRENVRPASSGRFCEVLPLGGATGAIAGGVVGTGLGLALGTVVLSWKPIF